MKTCQYCNKELTTKIQKKFCGSSCAAQHNNRSKTYKKVQKHAELIQSLIDANAPIVTIMKETGISWGTFKRLLPTYVGSRNNEGNVRKGLRNREKIFTMLERDGYISNNSCSANHKRWLKKFLIQKHGEKCSNCGWCEKHPITDNIMIEIDHIDGDKHNNKVDNVRLLCPNCHSLTPTFRNIKRRDD